MLENYSQQKRKSKMDWTWFFVFVIVGVSLFVGTSLAAIFFLMEENNRLGKELEENDPPF